MEFAMQVAVLSILMLALGAVVALSTIMQIQTRDDLRSLSQRLANQNRRSIRRQDCRGGFHQPLGPLDRRLDPVERRLGRVEERLGRVEELLREHVRT